VRQCMLAAFAASGVINNALCQYFPGAFDVAFRPNGGVARWNCFPSFLQCGDQNFDRLRVKGPVSPERADELKHRGAPILKAYSPYIITLGPRRSKGQNRPRCRHRQRSPHNKQAAENSSRDATDH
jgi:hypothetical protein